MLQPLDQSPQIPPSPHGVQTNATGRTPFWLRLKGAFGSLSMILGVVVKRLSHNPGLSASALLGITVVLSLVVCVPLFTNAILSQVLKQQLIEKSVKFDRSLFSMHAYYTDQNGYTPMTLKGADAFTKFINNYLTQEMGLEVERIVSEISTEQPVWEPVKTKAIGKNFEAIYLNILNNNILPDGVRLVEGEWPPADPPDGPIPVAVHEDLADANFINVGDIYRSKEMEIQVSGVFRATDPSDHAWFYDPQTTFRSSVWVPASYFEKKLPAYLRRPIHFTSWFVIVNDKSLRFNNALNYAQKVTRLNNDLQTMLPNLRIDYSPLDMLQAYQTRLNTMLSLFYITGAPMILLALLFTSLTASIAFQQVEQENATMRARGMSTRQGIGINLLESLALVLLAFPLALFIGWIGAMLMGQSQLFMQFSRRFDLEFSLRDLNWAWLLVAVVAILLTRLIPYLGQRRKSIVSLKQERSRRAQKPAWERFYLDFLLLIVSLYAYYVMRGATQPVQILTELQKHNAETGTDPLMISASALFAISVCMISLRIFPWLVRLIGRISERASRVWFFLAIQEITRRPEEHASAMLLIMISLSLAIYSASMAKTLDRWVHDSNLYRSGSDLVVKEFEIPPSDIPMPGATTAVNPGSSPNAVESLVSLQKHLSLPEIQKATFVGRYPGRYSLGAGERDATVLGIDRLTFPNTAFFRNDFATESLGAMMNALGGNPNGVLVSQSFLEESGLKVGDTLKIKTLPDKTTPYFLKEMTIAGAYSYFPSVYPTLIPTMVVNLDTLFGSPDAVMGYDVWLNLNNGADVTQVLKSLKRLALVDQMVVTVQGNALSDIQTAKNQPEWVGLFGILNVGFLLTGLMPGIGFVLYSYASIHKRSVQFGILQAIGLKLSGLVGTLVFEQFLLMGAAIVGGALIGLLTSYLFLPFLQVTSDVSTPIPPFEVLIGWGESFWLSLVFGIVLLITVVSTIIYLTRMKMFQTIKMGETI